jgi:DNA polymerase V
MTTGFPNPASEHIEGLLDLNTYLIKHPAATFFMRVKGDTMVNAGIYPHDLLIVDRSLEVKNNSIIIAVIDGELRIKRFVMRGNERFLTAEDSPEIQISEDTDFTIWGVVTKVIHDVSQLT